MKLFRKKKKTVEDILPPVSMQVIRIDDSQYVMEALGITKERMGELTEVVLTQARKEVNLPDLFVNVSAHAKHPNELIMLGFMVSQIIVNPLTQLMRVL